MSSILNDLWTSLSSQRPKRKPCWLKQNGDIYSSSSKQFMLEVTAMHAGQHRLIQWHLTIKPNISV